ncbi:MAG: hypothetical protein LC798_16930 [Chloroflexi bacterium]|nr:hypothetical protein [Chloroflexota bacterium]
MTGRYPEAHELALDAEVAFLEAGVDAVRPPQQIACPLCAGEGCLPCSGEGWVEAVNDEDAAVVVFRRAASAFLHPSGRVER